MTPEQKELVQSSFEKVKPIADIAATLFYGRLFELDPKLENLFTGDLSEQGHKLMQMIGLAVKGLDRADELESLLRELGARHVGYGVEERDYETVGTALLWTLERGLGDAFTSDVRNAWMSVYEFLAREMKTGAKESLLVTAAPTEQQPSICPGGDRSGWRSYFPAANRASKKAETEMQADDNFEAITGRFATTLLALVFALLTFAATAQANTYTVSTEADNGDDANPTAGSRRKAIVDANNHLASVAFHK